MPSLAERWYKQGVQEGKQQGKEEGIREGLYKAIELGLKLRFGNAGKRLFSKVKQIRDIGKLQEITDLLEKDSSLEKIKKALEK